MAGEALDPAAYIFEGFWTDWTKGPVLGQTWTLCPSKATLLTNSLALFVTLAGGQLWTIIRFSLHQLRASRRPKQYSERFLQQQVILRNASTDLHTMRLMAQIGWASRQAVGRQFLFPVSIVLLAIVHYVVFVTAGTLSNNLINAGAEATFSTRRINVSSAVLSRSPWCGTWSPEFEVFADGGIVSESLETVETSLEFATRRDRSVQQSLEYAQDCYLANRSYYMSSKCDTFKRPNIDYEQKPYTGFCPFGPGLCHNEQDVVVFETQTIDSHDDLGMNAPARDRLRYQRRTTCGVLNDTERVTESGKSTALATAYAFYGRSFMPGEPTNYTYAWSNFTALYTEFTRAVTIPYMVQTQIAYGSSPRTDENFYSDFEPLQELLQDKADLTLFFLSFSGRYFEPVDDPWFSAHQPHNVDTTAAFARNQYERDRPISTLGCLEQHQFCTNNGTCTPFLGWGQVQAVNPFTSTLSPRQTTTFDRMIRALDVSNLAQITDRLARTSSPLLAIHKAATKDTTLSSKLPDDQWRIELNYWHAIAMAQFQRVVAQWGTGQVAPRPETQLVRASSEGDSWFCDNMMVPSTVYQSFSVLWLALIVATGTIVILISWTIEDIADWFQIRSYKTSALRKMWDSYHMLKLTAFMMRNSWGPLPPPKDHALAANGRGPCHGAHMETIRIITPDQSLGASFGEGYFTNEVPLSVLPEQSDYASTPRTWSDLPHQPRRDSWVELGLKNFDFGLEGQKSQPPAVHNATKYPTAPIVTKLPSPNLAILSLRDHALARAQRQKRQDTFYS